MRAGILNESASRICRPTFVTLGKTMGLMPDLQGSFAG